MSERCPRCDQLECDLALALEQIDYLNKTIERMRRVLDEAKHVCYHYLRLAAQVLSQKSGVPRGQWAFWRGVYQVTVHVLAVLSKAG